MLLGLGGCNSSSPYATVPVTGKVELSTGDNLAGYAMKSIQFSPNSADPEAKPASSEIKEDGTFELGSMKNADGAVPGKYFVNVRLMKHYPPTEAERVAVWLCEPAEVEVKEGMEPVVIKVKKGGK
jgi:hypothetical protein